MIRLPNTGTYSLELITAQNGAQSVVSYSDATSSAYTGGTQVASITSATTTTICSTPAASTVRDVDQINIKNTFAGSHTVTVQVDANGTNYPLIVAALLTDESLNYTHGSGWQVKDANGNTKNSALTSMTSAQLAAILTDETGSGAAVFATGPTLVAPILGTPASGTLTSCTGLPISTGVSGLGTGVATALAVNVGTAGAPVVNGGALGTPSSGTVTNLTGTASININGTVGATTPAAGTFTTLTSTGNATLGDAEATDTHAIKGATTLLANSASAALTITQTGAGNALVVEDSASTDSTPFVVDASGNVGVGTTTPSVNIDVYHATSAIVTVEGESTAQYNATRHSADATSARLNIRKTRGTKAVPTAVASGDSLGAVNMQGYGGTANRDLVNIQGYVDTYTADNAITSYLTLSTSAGTPAAATERMRIDSSGNVGVGSATVNASGSTRSIALNADSGYASYELRTANTFRGYVGADATNMYVVNASNGSVGIYAFNAEQVRITSTASATRYITLTGATGSNNPTISTSAGALALGNGQLQFPATQNASSDANTLDDYEEGTWTPVVGGTATYTTQVGAYTKIGRQVNFRGRLKINVIGTGSAAVISGMPFTAEAGAGKESTISIGYWATLASTYTYLSALVDQGGSTLSFYGATAAAASLVSASPFQNGAEVIFSGHYNV